MDFGGVRGSLPTRITSVSDDLHVTSTPVSYAIGASNDGNARIVFGAHSFGLPLGEYMYARLDAAARERYGVNFRQSLNHFVDCSRVAHVVASACVDLPGPIPDVCIGYERELADVCNAGLDAIDGYIHAYFAKMNIDVIRFEHGAATLRYTDADATTVSRFDDGAWQGQINLSQGLRDVRTTFRGVKHE